MPDAVEWEQQATYGALHHLRLNSMMLCCHQDPLDGLVPQLAAAGHSVVERSSQLLRFYRTLARSEAVCTQELLARRKLLPGSDHSQHRQQVLKILSFVCWQPSQHFV